MFESYQDKVNFILSVSVSSFDNKLPTLHPPSTIRIVKRRIDWIFNHLVDKYFYFNRYKKLNSVRGVNHNKTLLLLGNGPSLSILDFEYIMKLRKSDDIDVFAVNCFADDSRVADLQPNLYLVSSPIFFSPFSELSRNNIHFHSKILRMREYLLSSSAHMTAFVPYRFLTEAKEFIFNDLSDIVSFNDSKSIFPSSSISPVRPRAYPSMSLMKALSISIHLGYERILLCGSDNDYLQRLFVGPSNECYVLETHSASESAVWLQSETYTDYIKSILDLQNGWELFSSQYPRIFNLDPFSYTTSFPKTCDDSLFAKFLSPSFLRQLSYLTF